MTTITLTTDLGSGSVQLARLQGLLSGLGNGFHKVDILHEARPYDVRHPAGVLAASYSAFPEGSIHFVCCGPLPNDAGNCLIIRKNSHWFIMPDNGFGSLCPGFEDAEMRRFVPAAEAQSYSRDILGAALMRLCESVPHWPEELKAAENVQQLMLEQPVENGSTLRIAVRYADRFGNVVTNLHRDKFEQVRNGRRFSIRITREDLIYRFSQHYNEGRNGDIIALWNHDGYLVLAIVQGNFSGLLAAKTGNAFLINFE